MESNDKLKEIDSKSSTCYHFDDVIKIKDFDFDNILIVEKSYENVLVYDTSYKTLIVGKPMRIRLDKVDGFIRVCDGTRSLKLFKLGKYREIFNKIRYLMGVKSSVTYVISINMEKSKMIHTIFCL